MKLGISQLTKNIERTKMKEGQTRIPVKRRKVTEHFLENFLTAEKWGIKRMILKNLFKAWKRLSSHWIRERAITWFYSLKWDRLHSYKGKEKEYEFFGLYLRNCLQSMKLVWCVPLMESHVYLYKIFGLEIQMHYTTSQIICQILWESKNKPVFFDVLTKNQN